MELDYHKGSQDKRTQVGAEKKNDNSSKIVAASPGDGDITEPNVLDLPSAR